jgi:hypothetical protein
MSNTGSHDPFGHFKHKLWPKEGLGVKLAICILTTKSCESPRFPYVQVVCNIPLESSQRELKIFSIKGMHSKLWAPKIAEVLAMGISGLSLGSPRTKCHLGAGLMAMHKVYYKWEGGGFPQVWAVVSLMNPRSPMVRLNTKSVPAMH